MAFNFGGASLAPPQSNTFGFNTQSAAPAGSGFGAPASTAQPTFGSQGTGGFGTSTAPAPTSGFSFGTSTSQPSTFSFGNTQQGAQSTSGFGFGTSTATSQPANTFSFGNTQQGAQNTGGFGFGTSAATSQPSTFSFGNTQQGNQTTGGFGFGTSSATSQPATFSFGNTQQQGTNSLFGNTSTSQPSTTGFNFGKPATSGFGFSANNASGTSGFGSLFGQGAQNPQAQARDRQVWQLLMQADEEYRKQKSALLTGEEQYKPQNVWQALALLRSWWDPASPYCRFKHYFYNVVPREQVHLYQMPPNHNRKDWDEAQKRNPDPSCMVPTLAVGFSDLEKRMEVQVKESAAHEAALKEAMAKINKMAGADALETNRKLTDYKTRQMELIQRVIALLKNVQVLRNKGMTITEEEETMCTLLDNVQEQLNRSEQFHGKLSQLWAQLQLVKESGRKYGKPDSIDGWESVTNDQMKNISKVLDEQQNGIQHAVDILTADLNRIDNVMGGIKPST